MNLESSSQPNSLSTNNIAPSPKEVSMLVRQQFFEKLRALEWNVQNREPSTRPSYTVAITTLKKEMEDLHILNAEYRTYLEQQKTTFH